MNEKKLSPYEDLLRTASKFAGDPMAAWAVHEIDRLRLELAEQVKIATFERARAEKAEARVAALEAHALAEGPHDCAACDGVDADHADGCALAGGRAALDAMLDEARREERERCAKVVQNHSLLNLFGVTAVELAKAIRALPLLGDDDAQLDLDGAAKFGESRS